MQVASSPSRQKLQVKFDTYYLLTKQNKTNPVSLYLDSLVPSGQRLPHGRSLNASELSKLIRSCAKDKSVAGRRDHALIALMLATGLRRSEVVAIDIDDLNSRTGLLNIHFGKGNQQRYA